MKNLPFVNFTLVLDGEGLFDFFNHKFTSASDRDMRQVKENQEPVKKVLSLVGNGEQLVDLFGKWQTEPFENKLRDDGSLPKNEYGNYELFVGELPEGVAYINLPSLPRLCKKLGIDYVEAVSGNFCDQIFLIKRL